MRAHRGLAASGYAVNLSAALRLVAGLQRGLQRRLALLGADQDPFGDDDLGVIISLLGDGPRRFNEIKRMVGGISQRMLTLTLRGLERDGLVTRTVFPTIPPRVDYELTDLGRSLWKPVEALGTWAREHLPEIEAAKARFDKRAETD